MSCTNGDDEVCWLAKAILQYACQSIGHYNDHRYDCYRRTIRRRDAGMVPKGHPRRVVIMCLSLVRVLPFSEHGMGAREGRRLACNKEEGLGGIKGHLGEVIISSALVLAEAVQDAACGVGVEKRQRGSQHMLHRLVMHGTGCPAPSLNTHAAAKSNFGSVLSLQLCFTNRPSEG